MTHMIRKQVYIQPEHEEILKRKSHQLRVTESEIIRLGIERLGRAHAPEVLDDDAWQEELVFMRERATLSAAKPARRWTRDELYDR